MQNEDDLRGLAKVMEFMRAISILFAVIHIYWYCYQAVVDLGIQIGVVDRILMNFQRTAGLFSNLLWTKIFSVVFLALSCIGTKGIKEEKITWKRINSFLFFGFIFFFLNWWMLSLPIPSAANMSIYILTLTIGYILLLVAGLWISRLLKNNLMDDVFMLRMYHINSFYVTQSYKDRMSHRPMIKLRISLGNHHIYQILVHIVTF